MTGDLIPRRDRSSSLHGPASLRPSPTPPPHATYRVRLRLSVILPFYNEAALAARTAATVLDFAARHPQYHFILVDDGSTDETPRILQEHVDAGNRSTIELVRHSRNQGKGSAVKSGVARCAAEAVCFLDGDLAYSLDHLFVIERALVENDIVIGSRVLGEGRGGSRWRQAYGQTFNVLARHMLGIPFRDTQAGLKGFRREVAEHLFGLQRIPGFGFDAELLYLGHKFGYRVAEIPAILRSDHVYNTSVRRLLIHGGRALRELIEVRRNDRLGLYPARTTVEPAPSSSPAVAR
jgi:glycosyltransferase involved in cell wall biosynthesis